MNSTSKRPRKRKFGRIMYALWTILFFALQILVLLFMWHEGRFHSLSGIIYAVGYLLFSYAFLNCNTSSLIATYFLPCVAFKVLLSVHMFDGVGLIFLSVVIMMVYNIVFRCIFELTVKLFELNRSNPMEKD